jgi:hypothetical protein
VSMPNHRKIIEAVFYSRDWDIGSHEGLRDYTEAAVTALHAHDPNWGHLRKNPGQTQIDGRGEDSALYRVPEANGKLRAVDFLIDAQLSTARPAWQPDPEPCSATAYRCIGVDGGASRRVAPIQERRHYAAGRRAVRVLL